MLDVIRFSPGQPFFPPWPSSVNRRKGVVVGLNPPDWLNRVFWPRQSVPHVHTDIAGRFPFSLRISLRKNLHVIPKKLAKIPTAVTDVNLTDVNLCGELTKKVACSVFWSSWRDPRDIFILHVLLNSVDNYCSLYKHNIGMFLGNLGLLGNTSTYS